MTAKKPTRSKQTGGGRVTPKGTKPAGASSSSTTGHSTTGAQRPAPKTSFDPVNNRQYSGHVGPSRSAHRGNR